MRSVRFVPTRTLYPFELESNALDHSGTNACSPLQSVEHNKKFYSMIEIKGADNA